MDLQHHSDIKVLNFLNSSNIDHIYLVLKLLNVLFVDLGLKIDLIQYRAQSIPIKKIRQ